MKTTMSKRWAQSGKGRHTVPQVPVTVVGAGWGGSGADALTVSIHFSRAIDEAAGEYESQWLHLDVEAAEQLARRLTEYAAKHREHYKVTP